MRVAPRRPPPNSLPRKSRTQVPHVKSWMLGAVVPIAAAITAQEPSGTVRGSVYDADFDVPLAGATIFVVETGQRATTNEQGVYVLENVKAGRYTVIVTKDGYVRAVRAEIAVSSGGLTDVSVELTGEFTEMDEFVVQDLLQAAAGSELAAIDIRLKEKSIVDTVSSELIKAAGASDAGQAVRVLPGVAVQDGKYAVIRGLPDRYVSSQMNGVRLPSADEDKRAVELDQFPAAVIERIQVTKTFTPDQQGDASGGAVDIRLKSIPDANVLQFKTTQTYNSQTVGESQFLTFDPGDGVIQPIGIDWDGDVGVSFGDAPGQHKFALSGGGKRDLTDDIRIGGFFSVSFERDSSFFDDGIDDSWIVKAPNTPLVPEDALSGDSLLTSLFDVTQGSTSEEWTGLASVGLETTNSRLGVTYLQTKITEDTATLAEDTRGKEYFFPGYDPDDPSDPGNDPNTGSFEGVFKAPYNRLETLEHTERTTQTLQVHGEHTLPGNDLELGDGFRLRPPELSWTIAKSSAVLDQPDKRLFGSFWLPGFSVGPFTFPSSHYPLFPAENINLGNLQRVWKKIAEDSRQFSVDVKWPFENGDEERGYLKTGWFRDNVEREFNQDSFSNILVDSDASFAGDFDDLWSGQFPDETGHEISESTFDIDYTGEQVINAWYGMISYPATSALELVGGARVESTRISVTNLPEADALWYPNGSIEGLDPGEADVDFSQDDVLPALAANYRVRDDLTLRASYAQTIARQTFKELTPVIQQEFLGGPIFIGNPSLEMSALKNYDVRCDYTPYEESLFSASLFHKKVDDPIEYVQEIANFSYTTAVNYPKGKLSGIELEARQGFGRFSESLTGLSVGANATFIDAEVTLPQGEIDDLTATGIVTPDTTRDMTNAPEHLFNLFATYKLPELGTELGLFYTQQGDTLIAGEGTNNLYYIPSVYAKEYGTLNFTASQRLGPYIELQLQIKNITNPDIETVYRSDVLDDDVTKTSFSRGIDWAISLNLNF
jgi:outer membrane receptor protein involved in Fe transport